MDEIMKALLDIIKSRLRHNCRQGVGQPEQERPQVVKPPRVVVVRMSEQKAVDVVDPEPQTLIAQVWTGIDQVLTSCP